VREANGGGAEFTVVLPEALAEPAPEPTLSTATDTPVKEESR
jgi:two-component system CitB family sensor kinase